MPGIILLYHLTVLILPLGVTLGTTSMPTMPSLGVTDAHHGKLDVPALHNLIPRNESSVELKDQDLWKQDDEGERSLPNLTSATGLHDAGRLEVVDPDISDQHSSDGNISHISWKGSICCTRSIEDSVTNIEMEILDNLTTATNVYSNISLVENEVYNGSSSGITSKSEGAIGTSCGDLILVPLAWRPIIRDRELLCVVNHHWLQFEPPSHVSHIVLASVYSVLMVIGFVGNGLVIYLFFSCRALRTPSNLFILNLALSDFLMVGVIFACVYNSFQKGPAIGKLGCDIYGFVSSITGTTSIMTLAAISFDRYLVISFPLDPFKKLSSRQVLGISIITWVYSGIFSAMPLMGIVGITYSPEGYLTTCSFDYLSEAMRNRVYIFCFFVAAWVVPLHIITFSYMSIVSTVAKQELQYKSYHGSFSNSFRHQSVKRKKNLEVQLAKVASGIIGMWVAAWTPYAVVALLGIFQQRAIITPLVSMIPALFAKTASCFDPYVYALSHPRFKVSRGIDNSDPSYVSLGPPLHRSDPPHTSLGPRLQRNTYSSNPVISESRHSRISLSSRRSKSLVSPAVADIYPRTTISAYNFRRASRILIRKEVLERGRNFADPRIRLQTSVLIEFPTGGIPKLPLAYSYSVGSGVDKLIRSPGYPATIWSLSQKSHDTALYPYTSSTLQGRTALQNSIISDDESREDIKIQNFSKKNKGNSENYLAMTLLPLPTASSAVRPEAPRCMGRSFSLPNMQLLRPHEEQRQIYQKCFSTTLSWKIIPSFRKNKSQSSLFQDDKPL
nr:uncharacterized protein LOC128698619 [Cherax quadricarinatus]